MRPTALEAFRALLIASGLHLPNEAQHITFQSRVGQACLAALLPDGLPDRTVGDDGDIDDEAFNAELAQRFSRLTMQFAWEPPLAASTRRFGSIEQLTGAIAGVPENAPSPPGTEALPAEVVITNQNLGGDETTLPTSIKQAANRFLNAALRSGSSSATQAARCVLALHRFDDAGWHLPLPALLPSLHALVDWGYENQRNPLVIGVADAIDAVIREDERVVAILDEIDDRVSAEEERANAARAQAQIANTAAKQSSPDRPKRGRPRKKKTPSAEKTAPLQDDTARANERAQFLFGRHPLTLHTALAHLGAANILRDLTWWMERNFAQVDEPTALNLLDTLARDPRAHGVAHNDLVVALVGFLWNSVPETDAEKQANHLMEQLGFPHMSATRITRLFPETTPSWTPQTVMHRLQKSAAPRPQPKPTPADANQRRDPVPHTIMPQDALDEYRERAEEKNPVAGALIHLAKPFIVDAPFDPKTLITGANHRFLLFMDGRVGITLMQAGPTLASRKDLTARGIFRLSHRHQLALLDGLPKNLVEEQIVPLFQTWGYEPTIRTGIARDPIVDDDDDEGGSTPPTTPEDIMGSPQTGGTNGGMDAMSAFDVDALAFETTATPPPILSAITFLR